MSHEKIQFEIITPDKKVYSEEVDAIRLPGLKGYFGVLPGHTPYLAAVKIGEVKIQKGQEENYFATSGGFVEVFSDSVAMLAETAEPADALDLERAENAKQRALKRLEEGRKSWDLVRARAALYRAINRIQIASKQ
ncbi:MAG: F0F1 ATP synthase subunit epsilon [bacterium]